MRELTVWFGDTHLQDFWVSNRCLFPTQLFDIVTSFGMRTLSHTVLQTAPPAGCTPWRTQPWRVHPWRARFQWSPCVMFPWCEVDNGDREINSTHACAESSDDEDGVASRPVTQLGLVQQVERCVQRDVLELKLTRTCDQCNGGFVKNKEETDKNCKTLHFLNKIEKKPHLSKVPRYGFVVFVRSLPDATRLVHDVLIALLLSSQVHFVVWSTQGKRENLADSGRCFHSPGRYSLFWQGCAFAARQHQHCKHLFAVFR